MTPERVAEIRELVDSYETKMMKSEGISMGLPAGYGVVRLDLIRELLDAVAAFQSVV